MRAEIASNCDGLGGAGAGAEGADGAGSGAGVTGVGVGVDGTGTGVAGGAEAATAPLMTSANSFKSVGLKSGWQRSRGRDATHSVLG